MSSVPGITFTTFWSLAFPGAVYDGSGRSLDLIPPDLRQADVSGAAWRSVVAQRAGASIARVWRLADDAAPTSVSSVIMAEAVYWLLNEHGILILAQRPEVVGAMRLALVAASELFAAWPDGTAPPRVDWVCEKTRLQRVSG